MASAPASQRAAGEPVNGRSRVGMPSASPGAPVGRAVSGASGDASTPDASTPDASTPDASTPDASTPEADAPEASAPPPPSPPGSQDSAADGLTATTARAASVSTPTALHTVRRREARPSVSRQAGPVRQPSGRAGATGLLLPNRRPLRPAAAAWASSRARSRSVTIRARAEGSLGAEAGTPASLSRRNCSHASSEGAADSGRGSSDGFSATGRRSSSRRGPDLRDLGGRRAWCSGHPDCA
ncbi:hypothetical protein STREPTOSP366_41090 [Streptomyces variabilis]